ncbi:hypothetical protein OEIGOIKO_00109 [Streptomyces chrestomyceticus JCM 4735]|uniref:Uncharacterized protein n=1 Tax=Streptomyces chrestomyceticus JCM 4735 TaxID=1306181 RepID=A0A7U9KNE8_9ACTN|nr:hypothetical protein [Streptomyces chrestomyceticus]GCD32396.1 hypothetical protein OEIGOIKO_00109 [Streptomyces chrestomyceticus JCM 4735]
MRFTCHSFGLSDLPRRGLSGAGSNRRHFLPMSRRLGVDAPGRLREAARCIESWLRKALRRLAADCGLTSVEYTVA